LNIANTSFDTGTGFIDLRANDREMEQTFPADRAQVILDGSNPTKNYCHPGNYRLRSKSMHRLAPPEIRAKILVIDFFDQ
jgi:hypothetical protein